MARILIMDTEEGLAPVYRQELEREGHEVLSTTTSCEMLRMIEEHTPDMVVLGIPLPGWEGLDRFARLLVRHPWIVMQTESSCHKSSVSGWSMNTYLVKSANRRELWLKLRELLAA